MSAVKVGNQTLPDPAPTITKEWAPGLGESESQEWSTGTPEEIIAKYSELKAVGEAGGNIQGLTYRNAQGRASLVARIGNSSNQNAEYGEDVTVVEELYAVDVIKDIAESPYFSLDLSGTGHALATAQNGKGAPLTNEQLVWIRYCVENNLTTAKITSESQDKSLASSFEWENWTTIMKELRWQMTHGVQSYYETGFVFRKSLYGVKTSAIGATFIGVNTVYGTIAGMPSPDLSTAMQSLVSSLPTGQWLYRPPQAEHLGRGRWRVTLEWQWAYKWSIVYGGEWNGTT